MLRACLGRTAPKLFFSGQAKLIMKTCFRTFFSTQDKIIFQKTLFFPFRNFKHLLSALCTKWNKTPKHWRKKISNKSNYSDKNIFFVFKCFFMINLKWIVETWNCFDWCWHQTPFTIKKTLWWVRQNKITMTSQDLWVFTSSEMTF